MAIPWLSNQSHFYQNADSVFILKTQMNKLTIKNIQRPFHDYQISPTSIKMQAPFN